MEWDKSTTYKLRSVLVDHGPGREGGRYNTFTNLAGGREDSCVNVDGTTTKRVVVTVVMVSYTPTRTSAPLVNGL